MNLETFHADKRSDIVKNNQNKRRRHMSDYKALIDQLRNGDVQSILIKKEEFLQFRELLLKDEQFKHFRGEAKQGGDVVFTFIQQARS